MGFHASPSISPSATPPSEKLRRWVAFHVAVGAIKSYSFDVARRTMTVPVDTGHGLVEVDLSPIDFVDVIRAPVGHWYDTKEE